MILSVFEHDAVPHSQGRLGFIFARPCNFLDWRCDAKAWMWELRTKAITDGCWKRTKRFTSSRLFSTWTGDTGLNTLQMPVVGVLPRLGTKRLPDICYFYLLLWLGYFSLSCIYKELLFCSFSFELCIIYSEILYFAIQDFFFLATCRVPFSLAACISRIYSSLGMKPEFTTAIFKNHNVYFFEYFLHIVRNCQSAVSVSCVIV